MNESVVNYFINKGVKMKNYWGLTAIINLYDCDDKKIKSPITIKKFIKEICSVISMQRHGETLIDRFGEGDLEGYSAMQFIETSSITAHFDEEENRAFIDIFSCKEFDTYLALEFCVSFFNAKKSKIEVIERN